MLHEKTSQQNNESHHVTNATTDTSSMRQSATQEQSIAGVQEDDNGPDCPRKCDDGLVEYMGDAYRCDCEAGHDPSVVSQSIPCITLVENLPDIPEHYSDVYR